MNVLSLCSGIGGLDLGVQRAAPEARTICYVEIDPFCQDVLLARMADGQFDRAPIFGDLRQFDAHGFRGIVDCVIGGPPCQPFSVAGKRRGADDARNLIPDALRVIRECAPSRVFLENVPGSLPYFFHVVLPELQGMGYAIAAGLVTAAEVGAPHRRQRLFVVGDAESRRVGWRGNTDDVPFARVGPSSADERCDETVGHTDEPRLAFGCQPEVGCGDLRDEGPSAWPPGPSERDRWADILARWPELAPAVADAKQSDLHQASPSGASGTGGTAAASRGPRDDGQSETAPQPVVRRVADGSANRVDRLRALGNAVVPAQAAFAWRLLTDRTRDVIR